MSTSGLGGGRNPFGSRGPDLIETIRLEKAVGNPYLASAGCEGIALPHASVYVGKTPEGHPRAVKGVAVRRPRTGHHCGRQWQEPSWNRPNSASSVVGVFHEQLKQDVARPAPLVLAAPPETKQAAPRPQISEVGSAATRARGDGGAYSGRAPH